MNVKRMVYLSIVLTVTLIAAGLPTSAAPPRAPHLSVPLADDPGEISNGATEAFPASTAENLAQEAIIIDHTCTDLSKIPDYWIEQAKEQLRLSYGHTSHGSQPITGMDILMADSSNDGLYDFNTNGDIVSDTLSLDDYTPSGDLGHYGDTSWADRTRTYLNGSGTGSTRNVVVWSWCGGVNDNTEEGINAYLDAMNQLETDYPEVTFIYMTGHLEGTGETGNLRIRNNQIRNYCTTNNKILFDFADIESWDPDGNFYPDEDDGCNWCSDWCHTHECPSCLSDCAHSHCFNCYNKGKAFWWMMARLVGWDGDAIDKGKLQKIASTGAGDYGQAVTYTIAIQGITTTINLTDKVPSGLSYLTDTLTATLGVVTDTAAPTLHWTGLLTPTPAVTITYAVTVSAAETRLITNTATISAQGYHSITSTAALIANAYTVHLPLVLRQYP